MLISHFLQQPKALSCPDCPKRFRLQAKLNEHKKNVHAPQEERTCYHCGKEFASTATKNRHENNNCRMVSFLVFCFFVSVINDFIVGQYFDHSPFPTQARQKVIPNKLPRNTTISAATKRHQYQTTTLDAPNLAKYLDEFKNWLSSEDSAVRSNRVGVLKPASVNSYCSNVRRFFVWLYVCIS
jgi:hypothetical protein